MCLSLFASPLSAVTFASIPFKGSHLLEYFTTPQGITYFSRLPIYQAYASKILTPPPPAQ
jgi:hypothetical protein